MPIGAQVFALFYAVLYGALFTISDKWRPFFVRRGSRQGRKRLGLAVLFFGLLPVAYFVIALDIWMRIQTINIWWLALAIYSVLPLYAFHYAWSWIVQANRASFYAQEELDEDPVAASFRFLGDGSCGAWFAAMTVVICLLGPVVGLLFMCMSTTA